MSQVCVRACVRLCGSDVGLRAVAPQVHALVRCRALFLSGRSAVAEAGAGTVFSWLCMRAPLWVAVRACELLRQ